MATFLMSLQKSPYADDTTIQGTDHIGMEVEDFRLKLADELRTEAETNEGSARIWKLQV